jgi:lipopolysaccharide biosynthesis glycosyltransferase|tara:strand:- start:2545 stop:3252 length:708 start_codon:yes stop_codon:yes gene_type:complete
MNVYIGYDSRQDFSENFSDVVNPPYQVSRFSIEKYNKNISIQPIILSELKDKKLYWRTTDYLSSTEFVYSRFLTPYLNDYKGIALFCDSDFLWQCDVNELLDYYDDRYAVMCVKHNYSPPESTKMDGNPQTHYPRKNWSSLMLFNCEHPDVKFLNTHNINEKGAKWLHRFEWTRDECIGEIPATYNWLEGWYNDNIDPKVIHYTRGGPWHETWDGHYKEQWIQTYNKLIKEVSDG